MKINWEEEMGFFSRLTTVLSGRIGGHGSSVKRASNFSLAGWGLIPALGVRSLLAG